MSIVVDHAYIEDEVEARVFSDKGLNDQILTSALSSQLNYYSTGLGLGIKKTRPFVIVDGVVYINATMIKENTL